MRRIVPPSAAAQEAHDWHHFRPVAAATAVVDTGFIEGMCAAPCEGAARGVRADWRACIRREGVALRARRFARVGESA